MKKLTVLLMSILLAVSLASCSSTPSGNNSSETETKPESTAADTTAEISTTEETDTTDTTADSAGKVLVVYYSATGSTEKVANAIASAAGADLFELTPVNEYSSADLRWTDQNSRVVREHDNPDERDVELVKNSVGNWDEYDTVFIGYPIWWQIAAWPVDNFIKANDFTGKTVIPFCTSSSSGLGESGKLLADMAGTGNWLEGQRFSSGASEQTVTDWVDGLDLNK